MNEKPHTHDFLLTREYGNSGAWRITYGDSTKTIHFWWLLKLRPTRWQIKRTSTRAFKKHERGTKRAVLDVKKKEELQTFAKTLRPRLTVEEAWNDTEMMKQNKINFRLPEPTWFQTSSLEDLKGLSIKTIYAE